MSRRRILFVAPYPPSPLRVRPFAMLRALASRYCVDVLTLAGNDPVESRELLGRTYRRSVIDRVAFGWRILDTGLPLQCAFTGCAALAEAVHAASRDGDYDLLHVEHVRALQFVPEYLRLPVVFDAVDCVSDLFAQAASHHGVIKARIFRYESQRLARYEHRALSRVDRVLVSAGRDKAALGRLNAGIEITVVPNMVDLDVFVPRPRKPSQVIFAGRMGYHANRVAADWLCNEIWPVVRRQNSQAKLVIAGPAPPRSLKRHVDNGVQVLGYVPDLPALVASSAVAVAPLKYAAGTQNKVLEALGCGTPVVATELAVDGTQLEAGQHVLVANDADSFARAICELLNNTDLAAAIGRTGRDYVVENHSPEAVAATVTQLYENVSRVPAA